MKGAEEFLEEFKELVKKQNILIPGTEWYVFNWLENAFFMTEKAGFNYGYISGSLYGFGNLEEN